MRADKHPPGHEREMFMIYDSIGLPSLKLFETISATFSCTASKWSETCTPHALVPLVLLAAPTLVHSAVVARRVKSQAKSDMDNPAAFFMRRDLRRTSLRIAFVDSFNCCFSVALAAHNCGNWSGPGARTALDGTGTAGAAAAASSDMVQTKAS